MECVSRTFSEVPGREGQIIGVIPALPGSQNDDNVIPPAGTWVGEGWDRRWGRRRDGRKERDTIARFDMIERVASGYMPWQA